MMTIFTAVVIRINEIPSETGGFTQKEIIVSPYTPDREISSEYIAIPPGIFPTDAYGSGTVSLPSLNQRCIVVQTEGYRRVQILSYIPFSTTTSFGEYTPVDVSSGGVAFKIGGAKPLTMYFHKGGKWELFSSEFCKFYFDGSNRKLYWTMDREERIFAGGKVLNTLEEIDGIVNSTRHVEIYTSYREWKQNTDVRIAGEKSVLNPESGIIPRPDYSYVPKVIIKAGLIINDFDSDLGKIVGHIYELETRQSSFSGDKDTVTNLKLGRQSEMYKYDNDRIYGAGTLFEWTGKTAKITSANTEVSTHVLRYGQLDADVIANGASVEYTQGEVYRNQSYINIIEPLGAPLINILAEGKGYDFEFSKVGATEQYLQSFGRLTSEHLVGNNKFLYKSMVREHYHAYDSHNQGTMPNPTGLEYDFIVFGEDNTEKNIFLKKFSRITTGIQKFFYKEHFTENFYKFEVVKGEEGRPPTHRVYKYLDAQEYNNIVQLTENTELMSHISTDLYKNYVKIDPQHTKTEELTTNAYNLTVNIGPQVYNVEFKEDSVNISLGTDTVTPYIKLTKDGAQINSDETPQDGKVIIGTLSASAKLATENWVLQVFKNHIHPTAGPGAPTLLPFPLEIPVIPGSALNPITYKTKGE